MRSMPEILARARNLSAIGYINKSVSSEALLNTLLYRLLQIVIIKTLIGTNHKY
jgi:hypothetical protein